MCWFVADLVTLKATANQRLHTVPDEFFFPRDCEKKRVRKMVDPSPPPWCWYSTLQHFLDLGSYTFIHSNSSHASS